MITVPLWIAMLGTATGFAAGAWLALRVAERRRHRQAETGEAERRAYVGTLATGLAHELRNPISTIRMHLELLSEDWSRPVTEREQQSHKRLEVILREAKRLETSLNDFLRFAAEQRLREEPLQLNVMVNELREFLAPRAAPQGVRLDVDLAPDLPVVFGDGALLRHAVVNLVINALEATPSGGSVRLGAGCDADGAYIKVSDTGRGVPPELRERIFEVYFSTKPAGTGLGLPTARKIVEQHGGRIDVESKAGAGSTFTIRLPMKPHAG